MRAYTYGISTVGGVLDLGLMKFHLLLRQNRLHLCVFLTHNVQQVLCEHFGALYLSFVRPSDTNERNVKDMLNWKPPTNVSEICSFLGLASYYRRFIEGFSILAKPVIALLMKSVRFVWSDKCQASFEELKKRLTTALVLILPDLSKKFAIYCDASRLGLGCVLM